MHASRIEDSLFLIEISKAINGDAKTEVTPLFKVDVVLGTQDNRVTLKPSTDDLKKMVNKIASELITVINVVSRVTVLPAPTADAPADEEAPMEQPSFCQTILNDLENPKSITKGQMCGQFDGVTHEWSDGTLANQTRLFVQDGIRGKPAIASARYKIHVLARRNAHRRKQRDRKVILRRHRSRLAANRSRRCRRHRHTTSRYVLSFVHVLKVWRYRQHKCTILTE
jgi:hypothetical protein